MIALVIVGAQVHEVAQEALEEAERAERAEVVAEAKKEVLGRAEEAPERSVWDRLADCESGNWIDGGASFEEGSARWDWARDGEVPPWGTTTHHGGLQFLPETWDWLRGEAGVDVERAYDATREQQIAVAEVVLERQGWEAWPVCSRKLGLR